MTHLKTFLLILSVIITLLVHPFTARAGSPSPAEIDAVFQAFQKAKTDQFSQASLIELYTLPNAMSAVKKLVDSHQTSPERSISPEFSFKMEATREAMNIAVLQHIAKVTGGSVEAINFGKQNGIRSDKDQTLFAIEGKRYYSATEVKQLYETTFENMFGIKMDLMDMAVFDGDAAIPDWRRMNLTFEQFVEKYKKGQAALEQNPEAYREAGSFRAQVDRRTAANGRVTLIKYDETKDGFNIEKGPASEYSERYKGWTADIPYRNAVDASIENRGRFHHTDDFIDKMKYFNRTIGDGINSLATENWGVDYIFHLKDLPSDQDRSKFIHQMVEDVFVIDASQSDREMFKYVIETAARIEIDKINGKTQNQDVYMARLVNQFKSRKEYQHLDSAQILEMALDRFHGYQDRVMKYNLVVTARQKIMRDFSDTFLAQAAKRYGKEELKKLRWETGRQIERLFSELNDPVLVNRIISDAPKAVQKELEMMKKIVEIRRLPSNRNPIKLARPDAQEALKTGPRQTVVAEPSDLVKRRTALFEGLWQSMHQNYENFRVDLNDGRYSDEAVSRAVRKRALNALGYEDLKDYKRLEADFSHKFNKSRLLQNAVSLGNATSIMQILRVYQQSGDLTQVAQTALWEIVSNFPGVSQAATLNQSFNDGDVQGLSWLFIAWKLPAAGQVKMAFDLIKGSMEIIYDHAMEPLKNDRFSQIYLGYVERQPAGWSIFQPGWKERRQAAGYSILHAVKGETHAEKRSNMYAYFHDKLDKKLTNQGLSATDKKYWEVRHQVLPSFFNKYVHDYFNAQGDFSENLTAGLYWIGDQDELKKRLAARLQSDFEQGELNARLADIAREKMTDAMENVDRLVQDNIDQEKKLTAIQDHLSQKISEQLMARIDTLRPDQLAVKPVITTDVSPDNVIEGQEAVITVKTSAMKQDGPLTTTVTKIPAARVTADADISDETILPEPIVNTLKKTAAPEDKLFVSRLNYSISLNKETGERMASNIISVNLAGLVGKEKTDGSARIMIRVSDFDKIEQDRKTPKTGNAAKSQMFSSAYIHHHKWVAPDTEICTAFNGDAVPYLWIRWPKMPENEVFYVLVGSVTGGIPLINEKFARTIYGFQSFTEQKQPGNAFIYALPKFEKRAGTWKIKGKLRALKSGTPDYETAAAEKELPFNLELNISPPGNTATGSGMYNEHYGRFNGSIKIEQLQAHSRIARIQVQGKTYYDMLNNGRVSFEVPFLKEPPTHASITYQDYGRPVTWQVTLEMKSAPKPVKPIDAKKVEHFLKLVSADRNKIASDPSNCRAVDNHYHYLLCEYMRLCDPFSQQQVIQYTRLSMENSQRFLNLIQTGEPAIWEILKLYGNPIATQADKDHYLERILESRIARINDSLLYFIKAQNIPQALEYAAILEKEPAMNRLNKTNTEKVYSSLATAYENLATLNFTLTGSFDRSQAFMDTSNAWKEKYSRLCGYTNFKPSAFRHRIDERFQENEDLK